MGDFPRRRRYQEARCIGNFCFPLLVGGAATAEDGDAAVAAVGFGVAFAAANDNPNAAADEEVDAGVRASELAGAFPLLRAAAAGIA